MKILIKILFSLSLCLSINAQEILNNNHLHTYVDIAVINDKTIDIERRSNCKIGSLNITKPSAATQTKFIPYLHWGKIDIKDDKWGALVSGRDADDVFPNILYFFYPDTNGNIISTQKELNLTHEGEYYDFSLYQDSQLVVLNKSEKSVELFDFNLNLIESINADFQYSKVFTIKDKIFLFAENQIIELNSKLEIQQSIYIDSHINEISLNKEEIYFATEQRIIILNSDLVELERIGLSPLVTPLDLQHFNDTLYLLGTNNKLSYIGYLDSVNNIVGINTENLDHFNYTQIMRGSKMVYGNQSILKNNHITFQNTVLSTFESMHESGPDLEIKIDEIYETIDTFEIINYPPSTDTFYSLHYEYKFIYILTNKSSERINNAYIASDQFHAFNCAYTGLTERLTNLDLDPDESTAFSVTIKSFSSRPKELCIYALAVNDQIDSNFSNNKSCNPIITSVDPITLGNKILIYPNPTQNQITIESESDLAYFKIYNTHGQAILENRLNANKKVDLSSFKSGKYIIIVIDKQGRAHSKQLIKN